MFVPHSTGSISISSTEYGWNFRIPWDPYLSIYIDANAFTCMLLDIRAGELNSYSERIGPIETVTYGFLTARCNQELGGGNHKHVHQFHPNS